jgi:hypothetical protein
MRPGASAAAGRDLADDSVGERSAKRRPVSNIVPCGVLLGMATEVGVLLTLSRGFTLQEESAFEEVVCHQRDRLFTIALWIPRDRGEAEDAVQETLISGVESLALVVTTMQRVPSKHPADFVR